MTRRVRHTGLSILLDFPDVTDCAKLGGRGQNSSRIVFHLRSFLFLLPLFLFISFLLSPYISSPFISSPLFFLLLLLFLLSAPPPPSPINNFSPHPEKPFPVCLNALLIPRG